MPGFLDLPGEIRNRIYTLVFPEQQFLLRRCSSNAIKSTADRPSANCRNSTGRLYATLPGDIGKHNTPLRLSAHLLRVCTKVHEEALPLLYTNVAVHFNSMKAINIFIDRASPHGLQQIKKLAIFQQGYGEPYKTSNAGWKAKHDQRWMSTCKKLAETMTGVQHLRLGLQICDWPSQLNLSARWTKPLFYLKGSEGLDRVDVELRSNGFDGRRLRAAARMVERAMMNDRGRAQLQLEGDLQMIARHHS